MTIHKNFPIAITGTGLRFPGGVADINQLWELVCKGENGIVEIPADRWDVERFYDPDPKKPGKMYVKKGGFLQTPIDQFDALFFGITPREADCMDPQQRLLLQVVWEALHSAGVVPETLAGSNTGVYIGAFTLDNLLQQMGPLSRDLIGAHTAVGSTMTILANRISYLLDLRGPSLSIDTACSSSLVAAHHACQAIWSGQCNMAIVGGVNVMFRPEYLIAMCKGQFLAKDGYCKSFDARADGYARGEGAGALVLKPLAVAERDGDIIHGVIKATGVNQDGRSEGITSPNREAQVALSEEVYHKAGIDPKAISYVEAHGTGTQAGDTAESHSLGQALGKHRDANQPLAIGSVKANLGHLEAASGMAGMAKAMLCLQHKSVPPIAGLQSPNPGIPFDELGLHLPRAMEPLQQQGDKAYAAVNSFGYGGTNAHILLEEPPAATASTTPDKGDYIFTVSAKDPQALVEWVQAHRDYIANHPGLNLTDYCYSTALRRGHYQHRLAIVADKRADLLQQCDEFIRYQQGDACRSGEVMGSQPKPVFVFTGMGPQWWAMGRELFARYRVFKETALACDAAFQQVSGWSILQEMLADESASKMATTTIAQPANFILQASLAALWQSLGIQPAAIIGHSVGEVTAAYVAGVLSLEEAARVSYYRSQIQSQAAGQGGMLAVGLSHSAALELLANYPDAKVDIAAINGPESLTLSGDTAVLQQMAAHLESQGIFQRALKVEVAYHSPYMDPLLPQMQGALACLKPKAPHTPLYSTVSGKMVEYNNTQGSRAYDADYWCQNARQAVLFAPAIDALLNDGHSLFLELGPHPVLSTSIKQCAAAANKTIDCIASLNRKTPEIHTLNLALAELHTLGCEVDWGQYYPQDCRYIDLPRYPWQPSHHWHESQRAQQDRLEQPKHRLLGLPQASPEPLWSSWLSSQTQSYIPDHCVEDLTVLPGAAYVELGLAVHQSLYQQPQWSINDLQFFNALVIDKHGEPELQTRYDQDRRAFYIYSRRDAASPWQAHASGRLSLLSVSAPVPMDLAALQASMSASLSKAQHYYNMHARGLQYGPSFQGIEALWQGEQSALAKIVVPPSLVDKVNDYHLHPALLDACFQSLLSSLPQSDQRAFVPTGIRSIDYYARPGDTFYCYGKIESMKDDRLIGHLSLCDQQGNVLAVLSGIQAQPLSQSDTLSSAEFDRWLYQWDWQPLETLETTEGKKEGQRWLLLGDRSNHSSNHSSPNRWPMALAKSLADKILAGKNIQLTRVVYGSEFKQLGEHHYSVDAYSAESLSALLNHLEQETIEGIIYLPPIKACELGDEYSLSHHHSSHHQQSLAALALIQGLSRAKATVKQVCCLTECAQPAGLQQGEMTLDQAGLIGLLRVAANEYAEYQFRSIDIDKQTPIDTLVAEIFSDSPENEVALRGRERLGLRMQRQSLAEITEQSDGMSPASERFVIETDSDTVCLRAKGSVATRSIKKDDANIAAKVVAATLTAADLIRADQQADVIDYRINTRLFSIETAAGPQLAVADVPLASHIDIPADQCLALASPVAIPAEQLAPLFFQTLADYLLRRIARLKPEQRVLIHGVDTPLGSALLNRALQVGADIYITLVFADTHSHNYSRPYQHSAIKGCFSSQSLAFAEALYRSDCALDVVINPIPGEVAQANLGLLREGGLLMDFSDTDLLAPRHTRLYRLSLDTLIARDQKQLMAQFRLNYQAGLSQSPLIKRKHDSLVIEQLKSLNLENYYSSDYSLQVNKVRDNRLFKTPKMVIDPDSTYLITGGFGGFGQVLVRQLIAMGVKYLAIVSRSGGARPQDQDLLDTCQQAGVTVVTPNLDIADPAAVADLFAQHLEGLPPLKGIVHTAGVLDDGPINYMTPEKLQRVMQPKVEGAWNLHQYSADQPLDFFVLFSSVASMIGAAGQGAYVMANTWLDHFAHYRQAQHLPATVISWGALGEVGMAAVNDDVSEYFERVGLKAMPPQKAIAAWQAALNWPLPHIGIVDMNWQAWGSYYPAWAKSPRYQHLLPQHSEGDGGGDYGADWLAGLRDQPPVEQAEVVLDKLLQLVAGAMKLPVEKISGGNTLPELGIDSLIAMELQTLIQREFSVRVSTLELMKGNALGQTADYILSTYLDSVSEIEGSAAPAVEEMPTLVDTLSEEQIDELLQEIA